MPDAARELNPDPAHCRDHPDARRQSPIDRPELWTTARWLRYYQANRQDRLPIPWDGDVLLAPALRERVARSIAIFQLGESSEGRTFLRYGREYAERTGDWDYLAALELFIREEQAHAAVLARFLAGQGWPTLRKQWSDSLMRLFRKLLNLESEIAVLLVAEWIAMLYYPALKQATDSPVLRTICRQIMRDERYHILFQAAMLGRLRRRRPAWIRRLLEWGQAVLMLGAMAGIWWDHRHVFRRAGIDLAGYWRRGRRQIRAGLAAIRRGYRAP